MFLMGDDSTVLATSIVEIELPSSLRRCSPVAVVTTSCRTTSVRSSWKSSVAVWPAVTVTGRFCST
jgi:hypothetical protein